jgi:hypothetical protein
MLVQHSTLGLGKIVALEEDAVHVFFQASENRFATKLRLSLARPLLCPATIKNAWLKGLSSFSLDPTTRRYGLAQSWLPQDQAIARFTEVFPRGFEDPKYVAAGKEKGERAAQWRAANAAFSKAFGEGEGRRLLAEGNVEELVRRALQVERHVTSLYPPPDRNMLKEALSDPAASRDYFAALFELLEASGPERAAFEKLALAVTAMPLTGTGAGWHAATLLPFIAQPEKHIVLRPKAACDAANRLGFDLNYEATPNWPTYSALLRSTDLVLVALEPLGARDHIDVECFTHVVTSKRASA